MRLYRGIVPNEDWQLLGALEDRDEGSQWQVYIRGSETAWVSVKVVAAERVPHKANYWLGWDGRRFGRHGDLAKMIEWRPALVEPVRELLDAMSVL